MNDAMETLGKILNAVSSDDTLKIVSFDADGAIISDGTHKYRITVTMEE
jgi:hypothetical protein